MRLYLIRHGQTDSNVNHLLDTGYPGAELNDLGRRQAEQLALRLADAGIQAVYSSDLPRAVQTATPLAQRLGLTLTHLPGLREISAGDDDMSPHWDRYVQTVRSWPSNPDAALPGGDSANTFIPRFDEAIATIAAAGHDVAAAVSHGGALRVWVPFRATNMSTNGVTKDLENTQIITLETDPLNNWTVLDWAGPAQ